MEDPAHRATMSVRHLWPFMAALRARGCNLEEIARPSGLGWDVLLDTDARIPHTTVNELLHRALRVTRCATLGLEAARWMEVLEFDLHEYLVVTSAHHLAAIETYQRFRRLSDDAVQVTIAFEGPATVVSYQAERGTFEHPVQVDYVLGSTVITAHRSSGTEVRVLAVEFTYPRPADTHAHETLFRCPLHFGAPRNAVHFDRKDVVRPYPNADAHLNAVLVRQAERLLRSLPEPRRFADDVAREIAALISGGDTRLEQIARRLGLSTSTVRHRLHSEGTSYREVLDRTRKQLAIVHLEDPKLSIAEIGFLLGFSHENAFVRAFKRWTGRSPSEHRKASAKGTFAGS